MPRHLYENRFDGLPPGLPLLGRPDRDRGEVRHNHPPLVVWGGHDPYPTQGSFGPDPERRLVVAEGRPQPLVGHTPYGPSHPRRF